MAYRYKKPYRVKKRKSILGNRFFWIVILLLLGVISLVYIFFFSWVFQIKDVAISGTNSISQEEIRKFFPFKNVFLINISETKENILNGFPAIAGVKIKRRLPNRLEVEIIEREAVIVWCCRGEELFLLDKTGKPFEEAVYGESSLLLVFGEEELLTGELVSRILEIDAKFKKDMDIEIEKITLASDQRLDLKTAESWEIYFSLEKDLNWQLTQLYLTMERQISAEERKSLEYVDLRHKKIYYK